jgi:hypothetical protein
MRLGTVANCSRAFSRTAIWVLCVALSGLAQTSHAPRPVSFKAAVPFEFVAGGRVLPAGTYKVERPLGRPQSGDSFGLVIINNLEAHAYAALGTGLMPIATDLDKAQQSLMFVLKDGRHYLDRVVVVGDEVAHVLPNVPRESAMQAHNSAAVVLIAQE